MSSNQLSSNESIENLAVSSGFNDSQLVDLMLTVEAKSGPIISSVDLLFLHSLHLGTPALVIQWLSSGGSSLFEQVAVGVLSGQFSVPAEVEKYVVANYSLSWEDANFWCGAISDQMSPFIRNALLDVALTRPLAFEKTLRRWRVFAAAGVADRVVRFCDPDELVVLVPHVSDPSLLVERIASVGSPRQDLVAATRSYHQLTEKQTATIARAFRRRAKLDRPHSSYYASLALMFKDDGLVSFLKSASVSKVYGNRIFGALCKDDLLSLATNLAAGKFKHDPDIEVYVAASLSHRFSMKFVPDYGVGPQVLECLSTWASLCSASQLRKVYLKARTNTFSKNIGEIAWQKLVTGLDSLPREDVDLLVEMVFKTLRPPELLSLVDDKSAAPVLLSLPVPFLLTHGLTSWSINKLALFRLHQQAGIEAIAPALNLLPNWQGSLNELIDVCRAVNS